MLVVPENKPSRRYRGESQAERQAARRDRLVMAGLTERYFYESFASKDDLFIAVYAHCVERVGAALLVSLQAADDTPEAKARAVLGAYFGEIERDPLFARVLLIEVLSLGPNLDYVYREAMDLFSVHLQSDAPELFPRLSEDKGRAEILAAGLVGAIVHVAMRWVLSNFRRPREEVILGLLDLLLAASR